MRGLCTALSCFWAEPKTPPVLFAPDFVNGSETPSLYSLYSSVRFSPLPCLALKCKSRVFIVTPILAAGAAGDDIKVYQYILQILFDFFEFDAAFLMFGDV